MNNVGPNALCPSGSVRDVYLASSYNQLVLDTTVAPWVTLPNPETYYAAGNSGLSTTAHIMIQDALNALQATGFDFTQFDTDNDGYVDAIGFLHSGYGAEWGGTDAYGTYYSNRIWSHKWAVYSLPGGKWTSTSGKSVYNYHISPSVWGTSGSAIGRIGVIAHETGHFFGLPDLYDGSGGDGVGSFCLMANSWGFDGSQYYPPLVSAWSKVQLGWVTPTLITASGTYVARQVCTYPDVFQISKNFPTSEYLLIENRQKCSFDAQISGPGLAIFHIDDSASYTTEGYPGQTGWPTNGNHYRVALLQADGSYNLEKGNNRGDATDLFFGGGVSGISPTGTSGGLAHPNTKAYKGGVIVDTGITISSIGASSSSMPFTVSFAAPAPTLAPTAAPVNQFSLTMLTDSWSLAETAWTLYQISSSPSVLIASKAIGSYGNNLPFTEKYILGPG
jgi:M6 family metalloprotease-like protein